MKVLIGIGCFISLLGLIVGMAFFDLGMFSFFDPKYENARRKVFEETKSYNEGKLQQLAKYKIEYERANSDDKLVLKSTIRHMFADYDGDLPYGLEQFLTEMRGY